MSWLSFTLTQTETSYATFNYIVKLNGTQTDTYSATYSPPPTPTFDIALTNVDLAITATLTNIVNPDPYYIFMIHDANDTHLDGHTFTTSDTTVVLTWTETSYGEKTYTKLLNGASIGTYTQEEWTIQFKNDSTNGLGWYDHGSANPTDTNHGNDSSTGHSGQDGFSFKYENGTWSDIGVHAPVAFTNTSTYVNQTSVADGEHIYLWASSTECRARFVSPYYEAPTPPTLANFIAMGNHQGDSVKRLSSGGWEDGPGSRPNGNNSINEHNNVLFITHPNTPIEAVWGFDDPYDVSP
ncbi:unnamed protein product [Bathycoccus prasinos]